MLIGCLGDLRWALSRLLRLARQSTNAAIHLLVRPLLAHLEVCGGLGRKQPYVRVVLLPVRLRLHMELRDLVLAPEVFGLLGPRL